VIEALIVLAILGIVAMLAVDSFRGMGEKYRVEGETKQLYADLMDARGRAMQRSRAFFVRITTTGYRTYEDSNPAPERHRHGDGARPLHLHRHGGLRLRRDRDHEAQHGEVQWGYGVVR